MRSNPISPPPDIPVSAAHAGGHEPVFSAPWEAQVFALVVSLADKGVFTWGEWAETLGKALRAKPRLSDPVIGGSPYLYWIIALEHLVVAKGLASPGMLSILKSLWDDRARETPHGEPIMLASAIVETQPPER